ncbi:hypothetical protein M8J77_022473 [Diaphorina citri]|nr:hypothetical protein M8J77_022473 [Diaphorina citri]
MRPKVKSSGVKIVPRSDLRVGTALGSNILTVLQWNAGGITSGKRTELQQIISTQNVDVFCIMEANLTDQNPNFSFNGYTLHVLPKARQIASGILVGVKLGLMATFSIIKEMQHNDTIEITRTDIWKNGEHYKIYSCYNPPKNSPDLTSIKTDPKTIIIGDFNAHSKSWGYKDQDCAGKILEDFVNTNPIEVIYKPTDTPTFLYHNGSCTNPDLLLVSSDIADYTTRRVLDDPGSGHRVILAIIESKKDQKHEDIPVPTRWNFKKAKWQNFTNDLEEKMGNMEMDNNKSTDSINKEICNSILQSARKYIPRGKVKKYKHFWSKKLDNLKKARNIARRKAEKTKITEDLIIWRRKTAELKKEIYTAKKNSFHKFVETMDYRKDGRKAYNFISSIRNKPKNKNPIVHKGHQITDDKKIATAFNVGYTTKYQIPKKFKKMERKIRRKIRSGKHQPSFLHSETEVFSKKFTRTELNQSINKLKTKSSPGSDKIYTEFLKHLGPKARSTLLEFINTVWQKSVPAEWKKATIIPILKDGKPEDNINSYRPISLTSHMAKLMERLISSRLNWFLESKNLITQWQAGFRKYRSTNEQVIRLSQEIKDGINRKETTVAVFVDFQGAYDTVWRCKLLEKIYDLGIKGNMMKWISEFITQRYCSTRYYNKESTYKQTHRGLPQGAVLSTTLFNIYINDLLVALEKTGVKVAAFADDIVIWCTKKIKQQTQIKETIEKALRILKKWCEENLMLVNEEKTKYVVFNLAHNTTKINIKYNHRQLEQCDQIKYLGITFDRKLNWNKQVETSSEKATNRMKILKRLAGTKWGSSRRTLNTTYNMYIKPTLTYCSEVMLTANDKNKETLEKVQNEALRLITGAVKTTPINAMYALTNTKPIKSIIEEQAMIQYEKMIRLPNNSTWNKYEVQPTILKTQPGFVQKILKVREEYKIPEGKEHLQITCNPLESFEIEHSTSLGMEFRKEDVAPSTAKILALETIHSKYPKESWTHIYTDGSFQNIETGAGAGVTSDLFSFYKGLGRNTTNFDGEVEAIKIAVQHLLFSANRFQQAVIFSDSKAAIQAITNTNESPSNQIREIRSIIQQLYHLKKKLAIQWVEKTKRRRKKKKREEKKKKKRKKKREKREKKKKKKKKKT